MVQIKDSHINRLSDEEMDYHLPHSALPVISSLHAEAYGIFQMEYQLAWTEERGGSMLMWERKFKTFANTYPPHTAADLLMEWKKHPKICSICGVALVLFRPGSSKNTAMRANWDHIHGTTTFRTFECWKCNAGAGLFKDDPLLANRLAMYLMTKGNASQVDHAELGRRFNL